MDAAAKQLAKRAQALQAKLTALAKLKSAAAVEREWMRSMNTAIQLFEHVAAASNNTPTPWLFGLAQQALQTGPLSYGKPAQFKRMAKALQAEPVTHALGHPHARAVRRLLETLAALLPPPATEGGEEDEDDAAGADAAAAPATQQQLSLLPPRLSEKQCGVVRGWRADFCKSFGEDGMATAPSAGVGHRLPLGGEDPRVVVVDGGGLELNFYISTIP